MIDPLVPVDVDLRDFPYTPILRSRLFGSSFHAQASDAEWRAGMTLWLKSWEQVPAGSLPLDEADQCRLAELGRDLKTWRKIHGRALHGWREAKDGRLYHRVVSKVVLEAWVEKLGQQLSGGAGNAKRWGYVFDAAAIQAQIELALRMLADLDPQSPALRKKRPTGIPTGIPPGQKNTPNGNPDRNPNGTVKHPDGSPDTIASEVKRSKENLENRDVEVYPLPETGSATDPPPKVNIATGKIAESTAKNGSGQRWDDKAWVGETATTFGVRQRTGEAWDEFKDRTYAAVKSSMTRSQ